MSRKNRRNVPRGQPPAGTPGSGIPHLGQLAVAMSNGHSGNGNGNGNGRHSPLQADRDTIVIDESRVTPPIVNDSALDVIRDSYNGTRRDYLDELPDVTAPRRPTFVGPLVNLPAVGGGNGLVLVGVDQTMDLGGVLTAMNLSHMPLREEDDEAAATAQGLVAATVALGELEAEKAVTDGEIAVLAKEAATPPKPRSRYWWLRSAGYYAVLGITKMLLGVVFVFRFLLGAAIVAVTAVFAVGQGAPSVSTLGFDSQRKRAGRIARDLSRHLRDSTPKPWPISWLTYPLGWLLQWPGILLADLNLPWNRWYKRPDEERNDIDDEDYLRPHEPIMWGSVVTPLNNLAGGFFRWTDRAYTPVERWFGLVGASFAYYTSRTFIHLLLGLLYVVVVAVVCTALVLGYSFLVINVVLSLFVALLDVIRVSVAIGGVQVAPKPTRRVLQWATEHLPWDSRYYTYGRFRVYFPGTHALLFEVSA